MDKETGKQEKTRSECDANGATPEGFSLDIRFIENTPAANGILFCATDDGCGASCPSACTTSIS